MTSRYAAQAGVAPTLDRDLFDGRAAARRDGAGRLDAYLAAPTVQNHAAMLETPRHRRPRAGVVRRHPGGGRRHLDLVLPAPRGARPVERPGPADRRRHAARSRTRSCSRTPGGELWLLYTAQLAGNQDTAEVRRRISTDDGAQLGSGRDAVPGHRARRACSSGSPWWSPAPAAGCCRIFSCVRVPGQKWSGDHDTSAVMISDDQGGSWREVAVPDSTGCVHMNIVELADGTLHALFRSRWADFIYQSRSGDDGEHLVGRRSPTALPNNNSSIQQRLLADGRIAVIYNHASRLDATARRVNLYDEIDDEGLVEPIRTVPPTRATASRPGRSDEPRRSAPRSGVRRGRR